MSNTLPQTGEQVKFSFTRNIKGAISDQLTIQEVADILLSGDPVATDRIRRIHNAIEQHGELKHISQFSKLKDLHWLNGSLKDCKGRLKRQLPSVIFSGILPIGSKKGDANATGHTGHYMLDFDHVADVQALFKSFADMPEVALAFVSPSGDGVKVLIRSEYDYEGKTGEHLAKAHNAVVKAVIQEIQKRVPDEVDIIAVNLARHCFIPCNSSDQVYLNLNAQSLHIDVQEASFIIQEEITEARVKLPQSALYEAGEAIEKAVKLTERNHEFVKGSKHYYLFNLANYCNRLGVDLEKVKTFVYENYLPENQIDSNVFGAYDIYPDQFGTWGKVAWDEHISTTEIQIGKYVSDSMPEITEAIEQQKLTYLESLPGAGKSTFILKMAISQATEEKPFHITLSNVIIARSLQMQCKELYGQTYPCLDGFSTAQERQQAKRSRIVFSVFDSALKVERKYSHFVIDEAHKLVSDSDYRDPAMLTYLRDVAQRADHVIMISATPVYAYQELGYRFIRLIQPDREDVTKYSAITCQSPISAVCEAIQERQDTKHLVFRDNKQDLKAIKKILVDSGLYSWEQVAIITGETKNEASFEAIIKTGKVDDSVRVILCTQVLNAGVNIKNDGFSQVHMFGNVSYEDLIQSPARLRKATERNVFVYKSDKTGSKQGRISYAEAMKIEKDLANAQLAYIQKTSWNPDSHKQTQKVGANFHHVHSIGGAYKVSPETIYREVYRNRVETIQELLDRVCESKNRVRAKDRAIESDQSEAITEIRAIHKENKEKAIEAILESPAEVLEIVAEIQTDKDLSAKLQRAAVTLGVEPDQKLDIQRNEPGLIDSGALAQPARIVAGLVELGADRETVAELMADKGMQTIKGYNRFRNRVNFQRWQSGEYSAPDQKTEARFKLMLDVRNIFVSRIGQKLSPEEIRELCNHAAGGELFKTTTKSTQFVSDLIEMKRVRAKVEELASLVRRLERSITSGEQTVKKWSSDNSKKGKRNYKSAQNRLYANRVKLLNAKVDLDEELAAEDDSPAHCYFIQGELDTSAGTLCSYIILNEQSVRRDMLPQSASRIVQDDWEGYTAPDPDEIAPF